MGNVSFTGFNNIRIWKKQYNKEYYGAKKSSLHKNDNISVMLECDLSNREGVNHKTCFFEALNKINRNSRYNYLDEFNPAHICFIVNRVTDDNGNVKSFFRLNNKVLNCNSRNLLPLFTVLAKITRDLPSSEKTNEAQNVYINLINKSINDEAVRYIDYEM